MRRIKPDYISYYNKEYKIYTNLPL